MHSDEFKENAFFKPDAAASTTIPKVHKAFTGAVRSPKYVVLKYWYDCTRQDRTDKISRVKQMV